jgi:hypothetical protein
MHCLVLSAALASMFQAAPACLHGPSGPAVVRPVSAAAAASRASADPADAASGPRRMALLIGINDYLANDVAKNRVQGNWTPQDLRGAVNDVEMLRQVLISRYGFDAGHITMLTDRRATRERMLAELGKIVAQARPDDLVYIHFSGHGSQVEDLNGDERDDAKDETVLSSDARTDGVPDITDDELGAILSPLRARHAVVVLDSCHSGTGTRGGSEVRTRWVEPDPRTELYRGRPAGSRDADRLPYVLMTGAAANQSALDAPIKGRFYGLFSFALSQSLGSVKGDASAREIYSRARRNVSDLGAELSWVSVPEPQLEPQDDADALDRPLLSAAGGTGPARLAWVEVRPKGSGEAELIEGATAGAAPGSRWAIYPPGETGFEAGAALALATVKSLGGEHALATLDPRDFRLVPASRAVRVTSGNPAGRVPVRLDRMDSSWRRRLEQRIGSSSSRIDVVQPGKFARLVVDIEGGTCKVFGAGGLQEVAAFPASSDTAVVKKLEEITRQAQGIDELRTLENHTSAIDLQVRTVPVTPDGQTRGIKVVAASDAPAYRIRGTNAPRTRENSLMFEVRADTDVYLTIVNIDAEGGVTRLFPTNVQLSDYYPGGRIPGGRWIRIPDAISESNRAGFYWDASEPAGLDTARVFATTDPGIAEQIRSFVGSFGDAGTKGPGGLAELSGRLADAAVRGVRVVPAGEAPGTPAGGGSPLNRPIDWTAETVTFLVER